ncbi:MAG: MFS transporter [Pseudonocardiaceae bacterium]|nr:MFS transporter [Pseudonocardiaceae bacterium]
MEVAVPDVAVRPEARAWGGRILLIAGLLLVAANLRASLTGVGPLLGTVSAELGLAPATAGALNTLPLLAFAVVSPLAPALARRLGLERALLAALLSLAIGLAVRSMPSTVPLFTGTALIGVSIAVVNVLLPSLIKRDFPGSVGMMTGAYVVVMGTMASVSSGVMVPISEAVPGGWRTALGCWLILALLATLVWLPQTTRRGSTHAEPGSALAVRLPWTSPLAWAVTVFMGLQSYGFYVMITWLPSVLHDNGVSEAAAGWYLFVFQGVGVVASLIVPLLMRRLPDQRVLASAASLTSLVGYLGLLAFPDLSPLWSPISGFGCGLCIVLALSMLSLRAQDTPSSAALSGMAQSIGYLLAAVGPPLFGLLHSISGGWSTPLVMLCLVTVVQASVGFIAGRGSIQPAAKRSGGSDGRAA